MPGCARAAPGVPRSRWGTKARKEAQPPPPSGKAGSPRNHLTGQKRGARSDPQTGYRASVLSPGKNRRPGSSRSPSPRAEGQRGSQGRGRLSCASSRSGQRVGRRGCPRSPDPAASGPGGAGSGRRCSPPPPGGGRFPPRPERAHLRPRVPFLGPAASHKRSSV